MPQPDKPIDPAAKPHAAGPLLSEFADDPDMAELVGMFVAELPDRIGALRQALDQSDLTTLCSLSHQLKGAAGGYGFGPITDQARVVEQQAKSQQDIQSLGRSVNALIDLCRRAAAASESAG